MNLRRAGTDDDPYIEKTDILTIVNNIAVLSEIPNEFNHITIANFSEVYLSSWDVLEEPAEDTFVCDYVTGRLIFNSAHNGQTVTATYYGKGLILTYASRIAIVGSTEEIVTTLQDIVDTSVKSITFHTTTPISSDGADGDIWFVY